jgi:DNA helicase-2/ATP-dependent DNA helicase PcrA
MARSYTLQVPTKAVEIDFAQELNAEQLAAVTCQPGPALVIAGAGSGKTRTLTYRVAWLLSQGVPASAILLLTFTNKAAREMLERVTQLVPEAAEGIWGGTFHSIGNRILRRQHADLGYTPGFSILDRDDQEELIEAVVARAGLRGKESNFPKAGVLADLFSFSVNTGLSIEQVVARKYRYFHRIMGELTQMQLDYEARKRETNSFDFDDLLAKPLGLLESREDLARIYQGRFQHILVDEYQDTNLLQARLVDLLAAEHRSLMVVGDDAQSIYSWRGADCANILEFPKRYADAKVFKIETNYRSVPQVLELANAAIARNVAQFPKNLVAVRGEHPTLPALVPVGTNNHQAFFIAQRMLELAEEGVPLREMAVLYRAHYHSMELQMELTRRGVPFHLTSGLRFFEQAHVKDVASYLKIAVNPRDEIAFKRVVRLLPGVGGKGAESLWNQMNAVVQTAADFPQLLQVGKVPGKATEGWQQLVHTLVELAPQGRVASPSAMIQSVLLAGYEDYLQSKYSNYDARREDLVVLANFAQSFEDAGEFLSQLALLSAVDAPQGRVKEDQDQEAVTLSTIHQAKGLEWQVVFVPWLTDGMFPSARSLENDEALAEERRLFYVAVTRCRDELYLTYPEMRTNAGYAESLQRPSRFLSEVPEELMEAWEVELPPSFAFGREGGGHGRRQTEEDDPF